MLMSLAVAVFVWSAPTVVPARAAKRACTFAVGFSTLSVYYERLLVAGKKEVPAGEPDEWWGVFPDRRDQRRDASGRLVTVNVPADRVLFVDPRDGQVVIIHRMRVCRCPPSLWWGRP